MSSNSHIPNIEDQARSALGESSPCEVIDALRVLYLALTKVVKGPLNLEFIQRLFMAELIDREQFGLFVDLLVANQDLSIALDLLEATDSK